MPINRKAFSFADRQAIFEEAVLSLKTQAYANPEFFYQSEITALIEATRSLTFRKARTTAGQNVHQDFDICFPAPLEGVFAKCASGLEELASVLAQKTPQLFERPFILNDFAVQRYPQGSTGIGIHKDALSYRNLVCIITLSGTSDLFICSDRQGNNRQVIDDRPGRLVLLPAPGLAYLSDPKLRPLHGVDNLTAGRLSIGFRCRY